MNPNKKLKVGIYSPYIDIFGGGERYILSLAEALSQKYDVFLHADKEIRQKSTEKFDITLKRVHFVPINLIRKQNLFKRYKYLHQYDLFFYVTDGSLFFSSAKKNFFIIQSPLHIPKKSILNSFKLSNWKIICYSKFMQDIIESKLGSKQKIFALAPGIDIQNQNNQVKKENIILSVGRFFPYPHDKKHDVLIDMFKKNLKKHFSGWKLIIAGGLTEEGGRKILENLKKKANGFPINIMVNLSSSELNKLYRKAKIYWHATGFDEDLIDHPEKAEHFGISPIEAMANKTVPLVFNGGGLKDIIKEAEGGYLWNTLDELVDKTVELISNENLLNKQANLAQSQVNNYSYDKLYEKLEKIIAG